VPPAAKIRSTPTRDQDRGRGPGQDSPSPAPGLPAAIVRPGFIYGERDRTVIPKLLFNLRRGTFAYFGSGTRCSTVSTSENLVPGIFLAADNPAAVARSSTLTDGQLVTKRQFVGRVAELAGLKPPTRIFR
jgi:nucleoside-diphosphate-sugar epimerase